MYIKNMRKFFTPIADDTFYPATDFSSRVRPFPFYECLMLKLFSQIFLPRSFKVLALTLELIKYILSHTLKSSPYCTRSSDYVNF